jgi:hypothetical protein
MKIESPARGKFASTFVVFIIAGMLVAFGAAQPAAAQTSQTQSDLQTFWTGLYGNFRYPPDSPNWLNGFNNTLLAKAQPDECFQGVGNPANFNDLKLGFYANYPGNLNSKQLTACSKIVPGSNYATAPDDNGYAQPKTNQAYVWGLTEYNNKLWFGTIANTQCLVIEGMVALSSPILNNSWVCEGQKAASGHQDFRPPRAYYYDLTKNQLVEVTSEILAESTNDKNLFESTIGLRSAGSATDANGNGVVFLGGISLSGVNIFAFNAGTGKYLGSRSYNSPYDNIRQWRLINGQLYVGIGRTDGGEVWRWTGSMNNPFAFETVGSLLSNTKGDPAYLTFFNNRIFVSTWPAAQVPGANIMSIIMSPPFGNNGLTSADANDWQVVWNISQYEPEQSVQWATGGGALMAFGDSLYWGTMYVPGESLLVWQQLNPGASIQDQEAAILGTYRAAALFRGKNFGTESPPQVEVLYGNKLLPEYSSTTGWTIVPNNMGQTPEYGLAGFGNFFNAYIWWMAVFQNSLFVGTFDYSYLVYSEGSALTGLQLPPQLLTLAEQHFGADLWAFNSPGAPAVPISLNGVGNYLNYGIRTMLPTDDALYIGTANPMNLVTHPPDTWPLGGWELRQLTK